MSDTQIAARLEKLVGVAGSQRKLAELVGKTAPAVNGWLKGSIPYPLTLAKIAERTGVSLDWLTEGEGHEETELGNFRRLLESGGPAKRKIERIAEDPGQYRIKVTGGLQLRHIPVITMAQAGKLTEWKDLEDFETVEAYAVKDPQAIAVRIRGDSMAPDYKEGTVAILYPNTPIQSDQLVVAKLTDGSVLFKRLHLVGRMHHFLSVNPKYDPIVVPIEKIELMYPVGKTERDEL